jgi:hypothetical protein
MHQIVTLQSRQTLKGKPSTPKQSQYHYELDVSPHLTPEQASCYSSLIGILWWAVYLGCIGIFIDASLLSSFLCAPRIGHLEQVFHIFSYLKHHKNSNIIFNPNYVSWEQISLHDNEEWHEFYKDAKEAVPSNSFQPQGRSVQINFFFNADRADNHVICCSHKGILIYLNCE